MAVQSTPSSIDGGTGSDGNDSSNPKDLLGVKKVSLSKLPPVALLHASHAVMDGAEKYGPYNWRSKAVRASIYVDACERHLSAWFDGEEEASDSGVHHLGHAIACLAILLDALETGQLVDDRPIQAKGRGTFGRVLERLNQRIAERAGGARDIATAGQDVVDDAVLSPAGGDWRND